jgi:predicted alpha/beta hydrolase family esterase
MDSETYLVAHFLGEHLVTSVHAFDEHVVEGRLVVLPVGSAMDGG